MKIDAMTPPPALFAPLFAAPATDSFASLLNEPSPDHCIAPGDRQACLLSVEAESIDRARTHASSFEALGLFGARSVAWADEVGFSHAFAVAPPPEDASPVTVCAASAVSGTPRSLTAVDIDAGGRSGGKGAGSPLAPMRGAIAIPPLEGLAPAPLVGGQGSAVATAEGEGEASAPAPPAKPPETTMITAAVSVIAVEAPDGLVVTIGAPALGASERELLRVRVMAELAEHGLELADLHLNGGHVPRPQPQGAHYGPRAR